MGKKRHKKMLLLGRLKESAAAKAAERMGLQYIGFGRWEDKAGRLAAKTIDGKLVMVPHDEERPEDVVVMPGEEGGDMKQRGATGHRQGDTGVDSEQPKIVVTMEPDEKEGMKVSIASEPEDLLQKALDSGEAAAEELDEILRKLR